MKSIKDKIPNYVQIVTETLETAGYEAFIVGGCVRDVLINRTPKDWDVTTNATPKQIQAIFEKTVYENTFGTVGVHVSDEASAKSDVRHLSALSVSHVTLADETTENLSRDRKTTVTHETIPEKPNYIVDVTTYRTETSYSDKRHPDAVVFSTNIEDDLKRRDFTMNALAFRPKTDTLLDLYEGQKDIEARTIRTVGDARKRFGEDALRMLRAVRFSCELGFVISHETFEGVIHSHELLKQISAERIRDEFMKIIMSPDPMMGIGLLAKTGLLKHFIPELEEGIGCDQKGEHIYDVFEHTLHALGHAADKNKPLHIRLSALFHDIGKPRTRRWDGTKAGGAGKYTFYGHEVIGARMVSKIMERLKFPKDISEMVTKLVRYHMFFSDTEQITLSAVRRTIVNVGRENIWDLMQVRECDRVGMKKKEAPYRLRKYHAMIEEALRAPTSVGMLKINGEVLIRELSIKPGPRMGWMLHALLEECLEDDTRNNIEYLKSRVLELDKLSDKELKALGEKAKREAEKQNEQEIQKLHAKHNV